MLDSYVLYIQLKDRLYKQNFEADRTKHVSIGSDESATIFEDSFSKTIEIIWNKQHLTIQGERLAPGGALERDGVYFWFVQEGETRIFDVSMTGNLTIGQENYNDLSFLQVQTDALIRYRPNRQIDVQVYEGNVFVNYVQINEKWSLKPGDLLFFEGVLLRIGSETIEVVLGGHLLSTELLEVFEERDIYGTDYPNYQRSPRIIYRESDEKRVIAKPASKPSKPNEQLARTIIPPLVMITVLVIISLIQPRGIYIFVMLSMTIVTIIISITTYVKNVKQYKIDLKERKETYTEYLQEKTAELYHAREDERKVFEYHYPDIRKIQSMTESLDARIFEKAMFHHDFLSYRAGLGQESVAYEVEFNEEEFTQEKDELVDEARKLHTEFITLDKVPIVTSLMNGPVGYVGPRKLVIEQLQLMIMQTAVFQSYYDVSFVTIFPESELEDWRWARWLPHMKLHDINVRGMIFHDRSRDQVLSSFYQILKERKAKQEEQPNEKDKLRFSPHFVVLITEEQLVLDHMIMEFFSEDLTDLGVSLIFVQEVRESLPEHVTNIIDIRDAQNGMIVMEKGELRQKRFSLDRFPVGFNKETISRALAPLNHLQTLTNSIPEAVTFLEMYEVEHVEDLQIGARWNDSETYRSLAVPLGLRGKEDLVQLNLHEKAHGPHGLIAGTTGSGKSEIIQSYILSLAVNFHPYEVGFLLIDYKGGGMANLFKDLPHLLGTITNLDGAQSMRALASIKAELERRQRLFGEHDVNHINQYKKLYNSGEAEEPMPHLFLISDEFAELKAEQPEFMQELVSTARIGRSLGIHLILATQKPTGVVDDQIWSNSKFKLALKVQNAGDSNEILKTPDAAEITLPGRAYLQVGNNEIYELFQSAWSGAEYAPDEESEQLIDTRIYQINELGQYEILTEDLSGLDEKETIDKTVTELEAVIDYIAEFTKQRDIIPLPRPWLPPLEERIYLEDLAYESAEERALNILIGLSDRPEMQAQEPLELNLTKEGHLAVVSSPGYGKSTFLQTVVMNLCRTHTPEELNVYLVDFGTNGLLPLRDFPQVADIIRIDEEEKIGKFFRRIIAELNERKQKLSEYGVASIEMYERATNQVVPYIPIIIDMVDSVQDSAFQEEFNRVIGQIAREGSSVGIHLVMSMSRINALRTPILANIKYQVSLFQIDDMEIRNVVGRTDLTIEEIPGRGIVSLDDPVLFQTALPVRAEDDLELVEKIRSEAKELQEQWQGHTPKPIPMIPDRVEFIQFIKEDEIAMSLHKQMIPFALDFEEVQPVFIDFVANQITTILGDSPKRVEETAKAITQVILEMDQQELCVFDNATGGLQSMQSDFDLYANNEQSMEATLIQIEEIYQARNDAFQEVLEASGHQATNQDFLNEVTPMIIMIADVNHFIENSSTLLQSKLAQLLEAGPRMGIYIIACTVTGAIERSYDDLSMILKKQKNSILLARISDQNIIEVMNRPYREEPLKESEAYYIQLGQYEKVKIVSPLVEIQKTHAL